MSTKTNHIVVFQDRLHPDIIKAMLPLGKRLKEFNYAIDQLNEDAFVFGYQAHTTKKTWTEVGKRNAYRFLSALREFYDLMNKFDWKKRPQIVGKDAWAFYNKAKYSLLNNSSNDFLTDLFEISTFYKYCAKNDVPDPYEVYDLYFVWQKLDDIFFYFRKYIKEEAESKSKILLSPVGEN